MAEPKLLKLLSPANSDPVTYTWPLVKTLDGRDEASEIIDSIKFVCEDFPELKYAVENSILKGYDPKSYDCMQSICQRYNKGIKNILSLWKGRAPPPRMHKPPSQDLLKHVMNLCRNHAIKDAEKLNRYEPFSPEVYGETSHDMIAQILRDVPHNKEGIFLDLGSGIGQCVLQAAASNTFAECAGIEKAETPAEYAVAMEREFEKWMDWFGKIYTRFTLEKGDFLVDEWAEKIANADFVFVNNFAFGPQVDHQLKLRFAQMKEGAKLISSKAYCQLNFKFNSRNLSELGAMMRVTEIKPKSSESSVSWTNNAISYYCHEIDRTRLEKYFSVMQKKKTGIALDEDEMSLCSESNTSEQTGQGTTSDPSNHDETLEDNLDELYLGTTTRRQWQVLVSTLKQSKTEVTGSPTTNDTTTSQKKQPAKSNNKTASATGSTSSKTPKVDTTIKEQDENTRTPNIMGKRFGDKHPDLPDKVYKPGKQRRQIVTKEVAPSSHSSLSSSSSSTSEKEDEEEESEEITDSSDESINMSVSKIGKKPGLSTKNTDTPTSVKKTVPIKRSIASETSKRGRPANRGGYTHLKLNKNQRKNKLEETVSPLADKEVVKVKRPYVRKQNTCKQSSVNTDPQISIKRVSKDSPITTDNTKTDTTPPVRKPNKTKPKIIRDGMDFKKQSKPKSISPTKAPTNVTNNNNHNNPLSKMERDLDNLLAHMKTEIMDFIHYANTEEYSKQLKLMIQFEQAKKEMLARNIKETEDQVQSLLKVGLESLHKNISDLNMAVQVPGDLIEQSTQLADWNKNLESKVMEMELEVVSLEDKLKESWEQRQNQRAASNNSVPTAFMDLEFTKNTDTRSQLTNDLCHTILMTLGHRRSLMENETSLMEEIHILEKAAGESKPNVQVDT